MTKTNQTKTEIIEAAIAIEKQNRQIEADGHAATVAYLRQQESDDICEWFERCRPIYIGNLN